MIWRIKTVISINLGKTYQKSSITNLYSGALSLSHFSFGGLSIVIVVFLFGRIRLLGFRDLHEHKIRYFRTWRIWNGSVPKSMVMSGVNYYSYCASFCISTHLLMYFLCWDVVIVLLLVGGELIFRLTHSPAPVAIQYCKENDCKEQIQKRFNNANTRDTRY